MKTKNLSFLVVLFVISTGSTFSQNVLSMKSAVDLALKNNLGIVIAKNNAQIDQNNATVGNAGMLPSVNVQGAATKGESDIRQEYSDGRVLSKSGVSNTNYSASASLTWTIFDGFQMFADYKRLQLIRDAGEVRVKQQVISTVSAVSYAYTELVIAKELVRNINSTLSLYKERVQLANQKLMMGKSDKTEWLQAKVDLNARMSALMSAEASVRVAKSKMNALLMLAPEDSSFDVSDSLELSIVESDFSAFAKDFEKSNPDIYEADLNRKVIEQEMKALKSGYLPVIDLNAGYNYSNSESSSGLFLVNRNSGPVAGLTLKWNLFNGLNQQRQVKNYKLQVESASSNLQQTTLQVQSALYNAWQQYVAAKQILNNAREGVLLADENLTIAAERFRLSESTIVELKMAQNAKEDALSDLLKAGFDAKIAEVNLLSLSGKIDQ
ncbi:MAG TPA: TolC family protein [Bacteroidia bacterium]|jgi:outer membrane protein TolC|nr:TolC family protein [Bacteroidia bacterium]